MAGMYISQCITPAATCQFMTFFPFLCGAGEWTQSSTDVNVRLLPYHLPAPTQTHVPQCSGTPEAPYSGTKTAAARGAICGAETHTRARLQGCHASVLNFVCLASPNATSHLSCSWTKPTALTPCTQGSLLMVPGGPYLVQETEPGWLCTRPT